MTAHDQSAVLAVLRAELARRDPGAPVQRVETHISTLLLGPTLAWKIKKPVRLAYLDFRDVEHRLALCERELALNRRTAPQIYRAVRRVTREQDGALALDGEGALVEAVLEMARFEEGAGLDRMATRNELSADLITRLAGVVADLHAGADPASDRRGGAARVEDTLRINEAGLAAARGVLPEQTVKAVTEASRAQWARRRGLLDAREAQGFVRRGHGDLHLGNIVVLDGAPVLFDCLEFNEAMATTDIGYDLAFLLMDLWRRDRPDLANLAFNRWLDATGDRGVLPLLPLFMAMRATVRAHVLAAQGDDDARHYLDLALQLLRPRAAHLVAVGGYSGSGKSTVAAAIAHEIGPPPGARILSSDRLRKRMFDVAPETRLPETAYTPQVSERVYAIQRDQAAAALASGHGVIADAVFDRREDRDAIARIAREADVRFDGFWLEAPQAELYRRVEGRRGDPSDATTAVLKAQLARDPGPLSWLRIASGDDRSAQRLKTALSRI